MGDAVSKPDNFSKRTRLRVRAEIYATKAREEGLDKQSDRGNDIWENIVPKSSRLSVSRLMHSLAFAGFGSPLTGRDPSPLP
jgi:hypothetical protein